MKKGRSLIFTQIDAPVLHKKDFRERCQVCTTTFLRWANQSATFPIILRFFVISIIYALTMFQNELLFGWHFFPNISMTLLYSFMTRQVSPNSCLKKEQVWKFYSLEPAPWTASIIACFYYSLINKLYCLYLWDSRSSLLLCVSVRSFIFSPSFLSSSALKLSLIWLSKVGNVNLL